MVQIDADAELRRHLNYLGPAPANWVPKTYGVDHDVFIVGAGQSGTTLAFALRRAGIASTTIIDAAAEGDEGVWLRRARMETLRTPKSNLGPEFGIPSLSFQAWYESRYGAEAYRLIGRIARPDWAAYLAWFRQITGADVRFGTRLIKIEPHDGYFRLVVDSNGERHIETARKVVFATGFRGAGGVNIPDVVTSGLPRELYEHTDNAVDFAALRGKKVAVLGAAASAFDAASTALENGAAEVHLFSRRADIPRLSRVRATGFPGFEHFHLLSDDERWHLIRRVRELGASVPPDSILRASKFPNFHLHLGTPWDATWAENGRAIVSGNGRTFDFDYVIAGTGFKVDLQLLPELSLFADQIATWADRYTPPTHDRDDELLRYPYLGHGYELQAKEANAAPYLRNIHILNFAGFLSFGRILGDIASLTGAVPRLASSIGQDLFLADRAHHIQKVSSVPIPDVTGAEYAHAVWRPDDGSRQEEAKSRKAAIYPVATPDNTNRGAVSWAAFGAKR